MADDGPLIDPRLFAPSELLGEDVDHTVDVSGDTSVEVEHTLISTSTTTSRRGGSGSASSPSGRSRPPAPRCR